MFEIRKKVIEGEEYTYIHFADRESPYFPNCTEKWEVCNEEAGDNYGYVMFCTVYDKNGNYMFSDHGETYELWYNSKDNHNFLRFDYLDLWKACKKALKLIGIKDMKIEKH